MYGVAANVDLSVFRGARLDHVTIGEFVVIFAFDPTADGAPAGRISVEGAWELFDSDGRLIDRDQDAAVRECYRLHLIVGRSVAATSVEAPRAIALTFDSGHTLRIIDDRSEYESFSIQPGDIHV